jgi:hypothetical protein
MTAPAFDASQHGDAQPLPAELAPALGQIAWLSSLLIVDDLTFADRLVIRFERHLAERNAKRWLRRRRRSTQKDPSS